MRWFAAFTVLALTASVYADDKLPPSITIPAKPDKEVTFENYGHTALKIQDKGDANGTEIVVAGKHWETRLDISQIAGDSIARWKALTGALQKSGWKITLDGQSWNPPYASMQLVKNGKTSWLFMWINDDTASIEVVEVGDPSVKLALVAPTDGIAKVADKDDFPFLKRFPGAKFSKTEHDDQPFFVTLEEGKDPTMVATGATLKTYELPPHTAGIEEAVVYRDALKAAGWTIVEQSLAVTTNDPNLTAHYAKGTVDLWAHVHAGGRLTVADAGTERASTKLKADLDKQCKVAIYGVNFDFDKATLRTDATPALDSIFKLLSDYKDLKLELGGHTDNAGERAYNQKLSESRVATVKTWLTKKGIAADRLTTRGYADTVPVVPNDSPQNMAKNRRVELKKPDCKK